MATLDVRPEYFISQHTHTCLSVISGTGAADAVIGMENCSGGEKQQWYPSNGLWHWGGNQSLCLYKSEEEKGKLCLISCDNASDSWILDEDSRLICDSKAITVSGSGTQSQVSLEKKSSSLQQKWWTLSQLETNMEGNYLAGEHSLTSPLLEMCKKEIDKSAARKSKSRKRQVDDQCLGEDLLAISCEGEAVFNEESTASPEYLINQSTLTCLTVMDNTGPDSASIELAPFTGDVNQQWLVNGKQWHWAGNRSYFLMANEKKRSVSLGVNKKKMTAWNLDKSGFLKNKSLVLQALLEDLQTQVTLSARNGGQNQKWWKLSEVRANLEVPSASEYPEALVEMVKEMSIRTTRDLNCFDEDSMSAFLHEEQDILSEDMEYLVNQSTHTCLTVLSNQDHGEAMISLAPYNGNSNQQWLVKDNVWQWGHNKSLYLTPNFEENSLQLASNGDSTPKWNLSKEGFFGNESYIVGLAERGATRLILQPEVEGKPEKWWTLSDLKSYVGLHLYPVPVKDSETYKHEIERGIINRLSPLTKPLPHPRDIGHFPGSVPSTATRTNFSCVLKAGTIQQRENIRMRAPKDWQPTNMYIVAGEVFMIILPDDIPESQARQIIVKVGAHTDRLKPGLPKIKNNGFKRMPIVSEDFNVNPGINFFRSQYGGNLIFTYEGEDTFTVTAEVQNVVESPYYILGETTGDEWTRMKKLNTPFCILESKKIVLAVPTYKAIKLTNPEEVLQRYDDVMENIEDLAGFSDDDPPPQGKQWLVDDIQITGGNAHAGFPIMIQRQFNDLTLKVTPYSWVVWHEVGHNYQQRQFWSTAYGSESTVNLFSLYVQEKLKGEDRLQKNKKYKQTSEAIEKGLTFGKASVWQRLVFMMEIKHAFPDHGWDMFRHLNRVTRALEQSEADSIKKHRQKQYDHAYVTLSKYVGSDLIPHYERWSIPISENAREEIESLGLPKSLADLSVYSPSE